EPGAADVSVLEDGSNGAEAAIRVEGQGEFFFEALGILRSAESTLMDFGFENVRSRVHFTTDYIVRPGARHVFIRTLLTLPDAVEGEPPLPLDYYTEPVDVFGRLLGDPTTDAN